MKLVVHELKSDGLSQTLTPDKNILVEAVRPHIYRHAFPSGTLKIQILDADSNLLAESTSVNPSSIGTANYFHGYVRFDVKAGLKKNETYTFKLIGTGYTFSESAYIGWVNGYDLGKYDPAYVSATAFNAPLDLEVWERALK